MKGKSLTNLLLMLGALGFFALRGSQGKAPAIWRILRTDGSRMTFAVGDIVTLQTEVTSVRGDKFHDVLFVLVTEKIGPDRWCGKVTNASHLSPPLPAIGGFIEFNTDQVRGVDAA